MMGKSRRNVLPLSDLDGRFHHEFPVTGLMNGLIDVEIQGQHRCLILDDREWVDEFDAGGRLGSAAEMQHRMKIIKSAMISGGPLLILTGVVVFLFTEINIFPLLNIK